jgi:RNA polymerase sigma factor (sigma-70 family)
MNETDLILLDNWTRERDAEAFKTLAKRYAGMVYGTCRRILNNQAEAEDAAQECFEVLATTQKPVGEYLAPWLHRVACNKALTRLRAEHRRKEREERFVAELEAGREPAWGDIYGYVDEAIAELPDPLRIPVVAHFLNDQTHAAIAQTLGIPRTTITDRIDKGIELIRKTLSARGVTVTGLALTALIQANAAEAAPSTLLMNLGRLALSGAKQGAIPAAAKATVGFWTVKTVIATVMGLLVLAGGAAGYVAMRRHVPTGSVTAPPVSLQQAAKNTLSEGSQTGVPHAGIPGKENAVAESFLPARLLGSISGQVYDAATGRGIPFVSVRAKGPSGRTEVLTSLNGTYAIDGLVPGRYDLYANVPFGYLNAGVDNEHRAEVQPGAKVDHLDFGRTKSVSVAGIVRNQAGGPVAGATITAIDANAPLPECISGKDGSFLLEGLRPDQPGVGLTAKGNGMVSYSIKPCPVGADDVKGVDLVLEQGARVSGQLVDGAGKPVVGMRMKASAKNSRGGNRLADTTTDKRGSFEFFPLPEGDYYLTVRPAGSNTRINNTLGEVELKGGEEVSGLVLVYDSSAGIRIAGRVTTPQGAPVADQRVECIGAISASAVTGDDGRYEFLRLPEGLYTLLANQRTVKKNFLPDGKDVDFVLPDTGKIQCRIVDAATGNPVSRFQAQAFNAGIPLYEDQDRSMPHIYDADGRYWMELAPGDYRMCVRASGYKVALKNLHVPAASETSAAEEIALEAAPPLEVHVADAQGNPVDGAGVYLFPQDSAKGVLDYGLPRFAPLSSPLGKTGEDGVFRTDWLVLDDGFVYVNHPSYASASAPMRPGEPVEILLHQGGVFQGTVQTEGPTLPSSIRVGVSYPEQPELGTWWTNPDSNGQFRVERVRPGNALVRAEAVWWVSNSRFYTEEATETAHFGESETTDVTLHLARGICTLTGGVFLEGRPFAEFTVDVTLTSADGEEFRRSTMTGPDGTFMLDDLPAGEGRVSIEPWRSETITLAAPIAPTAVSIFPDQDNHVEFAVTTADLQ